MYRKLLLFSLVVTALVCLDGGVLFAQDWPEYDTGSGSLHFIDRGPGIYLGIVKLVCCVLVFLMWVKTSDWVSEDCREVGESVGLSGDVWNPIVVFSFLVGFLCAISIPIFAVGYSLLVISYIVPLGTYIVMRNSKVADNDRVLTADHIKRMLSGKRSKREVTALHDQGAPVEIQSMTGDDQQRQANIISARQDPNYLVVKDLFFDALNKQTTKILLDYTRDSVAVRFLIDGIWHNLDARDRESADAMLVVLKQICGCKPEDRRNRQQGEFALKWKGRKFDGTFTSQGVKSGERVVMEILPNETPFKKMEDLGMREKMQEQLTALLKSEKGFFVMSAAPEGGLSTTWDIGLLNTDRLMRDYMGIEDKDKPETNVQNIEIHTFNAAAGETPATVLPKLMLKQPEVLVVPDLVDGASVNALCDYIINEKKLVITKLGAKESVEALLRVLLLKAPAEKFSNVVLGVLNQRLIRKLCKSCKQAYEPPPQLLQRLGIPAGRVREFYREWQPPPPGEEQPKKKKGEPDVCPKCGGIGYRGRTAIFELLVVNEEIRAVLKQQPNLETLRAAARRAGLRTIREEGILLVATGVTSLQELQRILK